VLPLHLDHKIGQRPHELLVKRPDAARSFIVLTPRFIVIASTTAKRAQNLFQIVLILKPNMLLH
jgi:hypothetical protein